MEKVVNLTPHDVVIYKKNKPVAVFPSAGSIRLTEKVKEASPVAGVPTVITEFNGVSVVLTQDFCTQVQDAVVIVSLPVLQAIRENPFIKEKIKKVLKDKNIILKTIVAPDTGNDSVVKNEKNQIIGVKRFRTLERS